ncbi:MAG: hypothetical protein H6Q55_572 [Deltaproteobacteria bacterium]|nr:hypothetical protein [Deltaproteobacteria bacterium]
MQSISAETLGWTGMDREWTGMDREWTGMDREWTGMDRQWTGNGTRMAQSLGQTERET